MKAVNLIPADARKNRRSAPNAARVPTYALLGVLAAALALVTAYVLTGNTISNRQAQVNTLQAEVTQAQAQASKLGSYGKFAQIAQTRLQTVTGIAATRFDWHTALADLSEVVPANTTLQTLSGTVAPGANSGAGGGSSNLRADETTPALELTGCTGGQDDVARLMSRLRLIDGVTRVSLGNSQKSASPSGGASSATGSCAPGGATFNMVVFFRAQPGAGPNGAASVAGATPTTATTPTTTTTKPGGSS